MVLWTASDKRWTASYQDLTVHLDRWPLVCQNISHPEKHRWADARPLAKEAALQPLKHFVMIGEWARRLEVEGDQPATACPIWRTIAAPAADPAVGEFNALPVAVVVVHMVVAAEDTDHAARLVEQLE